MDLTYERAREELVRAHASARPDRDGMQLIDCHSCGGRPPRGAVYIGRATPALPRSPLANPYMAKSTAKRNKAAAQWCVVVDDDRVLEFYRRHLTYEVVREQEEPIPGGRFEALRQLAEGATLACWCCTRPAVRLEPGPPRSERLCHGDVVYTVWLALERLGWSVPTRPGKTRHEARDRTWAAFYERAFGEPMRWGAREDQA